jgi:hypothetical protein
MEKLKKRATPSDRPKTPDQISFRSKRDVIPSQEKATAITRENAACKASTRLRPFSLTLRCFVSVFQSVLISCRTITGQPRRAGDFKFETDVAEALRCTGWFGSFFI